MRPVTVFKMLRQADSSWKREEDYKGIFHEWGLELWEQEPATVSYSVAIVEQMDGNVLLVAPHLIRFDDNEPENEA